MITARRGTINVRFINKVNDGNEHEFAGVKLNYELEGEGTS